MFRGLCWTLAEFSCITGALLCAQDSPDLGSRVRTRIRTELAHLPNFVCNQTMQRFVRNSSEQEWKPSDTLHWEIALEGDQELYALAGSKRFDSRTPAEIIGKGTISTGTHALLLKHVFATNGPAIRFQRETEWKGRKAYEFDYDVPLDHSRYWLRFGAAEEVVAFQGSFVVDADSLDMLQFEAQAYDVSEKLGVNDARTTLQYDRVRVGESEILVPVASTHFVASALGMESLNRSKMTGCRQFTAESALVADVNPLAVEPEAAASDTEPTASESDLKGVIETALETPIPLDQASVGLPVAAVVHKALRAEGKVLVPEGARLSGRIVRLERLRQPYELFEIGFELDALEAEGRVQAIALTLVDAGPASGLIRQQKRLDPTFSRRRTPQMNILVREVQRGQGILHWDARRPELPRGLRMKWRVQD